MTDATATPTRRTLHELIDPRIAERRQQVDEDHGRRRRHVVAAVLSVAALVAVCVASLFSPVLDVDRIEVIGSDALSESDVMSIADVRPGDAMVTVDSAELTERLAADVAVARVTVRRRWPGTIEFRITDRVPGLRLVGAEGSKLVAADGVVIDDADPPPTFGIWDLHVDLLSDVGPGAREADNLAAVIAVASAVPNMVRIRLLSMSLDDLGELRLDIGEDREIVFGPPDQAREKFTAIVTLLDGRVDLDGLCRLDVTDPFAARITRVPFCDRTVPDPAPTPAPAPDVGDDEAVAPSPTEASGDDDPTGVAPTSSE